MNCEKNDVVLKLMLAVKIILSLFISGEIIFKGDAGNLVHSVGNFIANGSGLMGLMLLTILLAIVITLINIATEKCINVQKLKNNLLLYDIILTICTFGLGIFMMTAIRNMPVNYALSSLSFLICGATPLYILMSIIPIFFVKYAKSKGENDIVYSSSEINNNPFSYRGRITRLPYFITKSCLFVVFLINLYLINNIQVENILLFCGVCMLSLIYILPSLFIVNKRLNDMKWNKFLILIWLIPYIGIVIGLPMFFVKSKYQDEEKQGQ